MKGLRSLVAELSSSWLKRRKAQAAQTAGPKTANPQTLSPKTASPKAVNTAKASPRVAEHKTRQRPPHKPKPLSSRDVASNM
ncbi:hypothetical protein [Mesorhizobium sangaii]|uniref:Uncharacterized protein n=1 Tax=Mesorhizobium sangaii TaxID=505389 RepID=A0A841PAU6_9HYPH|nr:hypothetical protein [Mesorhizobium sangaii]MBB6412256.1 hypothetical protein [Mesorhizobium sangaii]